MPMDPSISALLDAFPEAVVLIRRGYIAACNAMAGHYIPQLVPGALPPACLPVESGVLSGSFTLGGSTFSFSSSTGPEGQTILFRPAEQSVLTDAQLSGALRQLRQFMGELLLELSDCGSASACKRFYRMFRLLDNLEYMQLIRHEPPPAQPLPPMDLAGLCHQTVQQVAPLLAEAGIALEYSSRVSSLLIPGLPSLVCRALLELIANSARAADQGHITLRLRTGGGRALLVLSDSGEALSSRQIGAMLQQDTDWSIPDPGAGAGLGLSIVRHIAQLHRGSFFIRWDDNVPTAILSLPTGPMGGSLSVCSPTAKGGGLSPLLVALADVLPAHLFLEAGLD